MKKSFSFRSWEEPFPKSNNLLAYCIPPYPLILLLTMFSSGEKIGTKIGSDEFHSQCAQI